MHAKFHKIQWFSSPQYIIAVCVSAVVVSVAVLLLTLFSPSADIEDANGSNNTDLAVIGMNEILSDVDEYSSYLNRATQKGLQTNISGRLSKYDYQECSFACKKISGIKTLQATKVTQEQLTLEFSSQLDAGNLEIVIIVNGEYHSNVPINQYVSVVLTEMAGKTVIVKLAAESATLNVSVKRHEE